MRKLFVLPLLLSFAACTVPNGTKPKCREAGEACKETGECCSEKCVKNKCE